MVLGHSVKSYRHMMKNMISSLIIHERIETTHAKVRSKRHLGEKITHCRQQADQSSEEGRERSHEPFEFAEGKSGH